MTVTSTGHHFPTQFFGLSTDTKPDNAMVASTFFETDTQSEFVYSGTAWIRRINKDFLLDVSLGNVTGHRIMRALGERENIQTTAMGEDLWRGNDLAAAPTSHLLIPTPAAAGERMTLDSESDADNGATATGALTVRIHYLDADGDEQIETVTMNGQTAVNTDATDIRFVQDLQVATVGSNTVAEGNIFIHKFGTAGLVYSMIAAGGNQSLVPHKMVPRAKILHLRNWMGSEMTTAKRTIVRLRADCSNASPPIKQSNVFLFKSTMMLDGASAQQPLAYAIPSMSIVKASAWSQVNGAECAIHWWGILVDD